MRYRKTNRIAIDKGVSLSLADIKLSQLESETPLNIVTNWPLSRKYSNKSKRGREEGIENHLCLFFPLSTLDHQAESRDRRNRPISRRIQRQSVDPKSTVPFFELIKLKVNKCVCVPPISLIRHQLMALMTRKQGPVINRGTGGAPRYAASMCGHNDTLATFLN